jgi:Uma2 family endonuclease
MSTICQSEVLPRDERFVLWGIDWQTYLKISEALGDRPIRLTFDGWNLEFMSPSVVHERIKKVIGRFIEALTFERKIPICGAGSMTIRRETVERGLEPDECYWITNEPALRGKLEIDLEVDPPPDLAIEVDITSSSLNRQNIYAAFGIPEIWRFDGKALRILILHANGKYRERSQSKCLPFLPVQELVQFLDFKDGLDDNARLERFLEWARQGFPATNDMD